MQIQSHIKLSDHTSFGVGGDAEYFAFVHDTDELVEALRCTLPETPLWILGYGSNSLVSDSGLAGMVICVRGGKITVEDTMIVADAGAWWDDVVKTAISHSLWGIELMSEIPGSVGGGVFINITAYGQSIGPVVEWIDVWDRESQQVKRLNKDALKWDYKQSYFQTEAAKKLVILRVCFALSKSKTDDLTYQKAVDVASELRLNSDDLDDRRKIIIETRRRAGSLWHPKGGEAKTTGSFFRNPMVSGNQIDALIAFDETGKTAQEIKKMNQVHGGSSQRVSAAHVMLAAGFHRGQNWGKVKLNDQNLLKIEALEGATAQDIYNVVREIQTTCYDKLGIQLEAEARILGEFNN